MKKKKIGKKIAGAIALLLVVALLAALPLLTKKDEDSGNRTELRSAVAENREIAVQIIGGGQLESEGEFNLKIPENVKITRYLVGNGDVVNAGDSIAVVDPVSVMTAITEVQQTLNDLSTEITKAASSSSTEYLTSSSAGRIKKIYASAGDSVQEVMLEHGCLAVVSLDDTMAVAIDTDQKLSPGDKVNVEVNGKTVTGRVRSSAAGEMVVSIEDNKYSVDTMVTVSTWEGEELGSGALYVYNAWNLTAYDGTVSRILVKEENTIAANRNILSITSSGNSAEYQRLIDKRQKYEALMEELFQLYRTRLITASVDGIVTGVDTDGEFMLTAMQEGEFRVVLLSEIAPEPESAGPTITTSSLPTGTVGSEYTAQLMISDSSLGGSWTQEGLPNGLSLNASSGLVSGTPSAECTGLPVTFSYVVNEAVVATKTLNLTINPKPAEPKENYTFYYAQITQIGGNTMMVKQSEAVATSDDPSFIPSTAPAVTALTNEGVVYSGQDVVSGGLAANDFVWVVVDSNGNLVKLTKAGSNGNTPGGGSGGFPSSGGMPSMSGGGKSGMSGMSGFGVEEEDPYYTLDKLTIATITSQENMTVTITIDELDITKIYMGQVATITMNSLAEEPTEAVVTEISNSGENSGGNSKFTLKLKLNRSSEMLPGMNATATFTLSKDTVLSVPSEALYEVNGKTVVYTGYDEEKETFLNPVEVTIGIADADYVQILSGLEAGTTVYYEHYEPEIEPSMPAGMPMGAPGGMSA